MTHLASVLGGQIDAWPRLQSCDAHVQSARAADGSDAPVRVLARASHHLGRTGIRSDHSSCDPRCVGLLAGCSCGWRSSLHDRGQRFRSYLSPTAGWSTRHQIIVCREQRRSLTSYAVHIVTCAQHEANATCLPTEAGAGAGAGAGAPKNGVTASASRCNSRALVTVAMADPHPERASAGPAFRAGPPPVPEAGQGEVRSSARMLGPRDRLMKHETTGHDFASTNARSVGGTGDDGSMTVTVTCSEGSGVQE